MMGGDDTWLKALWAASGKAWQASTNGAGALPPRWWSFERRGQQFRKLRSLTLCVVIYYGFRKKWWKTLNECPLISYTSTVLDSIGPPAEQAADPADGHPEVGEDAHEEPADEADMVERMNKAQAREELSRRRGQTNKSQIKF